MVHPQEGNQLYFTGHNSFPFLKLFTLFLIFYNLHSMRNSPKTMEGKECCCSLVAKSCPSLLQPCRLYVACQAPLFMGFPRQEYWNGLPFPSPGALYNPGFEPRSPALQADSLPSELPGKPGMLFI